jgi:hypothetical protein
MEETSMINFSRGIYNVSNKLRKRRKHSDTRKEYGKKKRVSTTWQIRSMIVNEYFEYETSNIGGTLLQAFIGGKPVENLLFLELKTLKDSTKVDDNFRNFNSRNGSEKIRFIYIKFG